MAVQLLTYIKGLLTGDLGTSYTFKTPVLDMILTRLPVTVSMIVVAMGFALLIGVPAGVWAGRRAGAWQDRAVTTVSTLGLATPNFVLGLLLVLVLGVWSGLLPATGYTSISEGLWPWLRHLLMPGFRPGSLSPPPRSPGNCAPPWPTRCAGTTSGRRSRRACCRER